MLRRLTALVSIAPSVAVSGRWEVHASTTDIPTFASLCQTRIILPGRNQGVPLLSDESASKADAVLLDVPVIGES